MRKQTFLPTSSNPPIPAIRPCSRFTSHVPRDLPGLNVRRPNNKGTGRDRASSVHRATKAGRRIARAARVVPIRDSVHRSRGPPPVPLRPSRPPQIQSSKLQLPAHPMAKQAIARRKSVAATAIAIEVKPHRVRRARRRVTPPHRQTHPLRRRQLRRTSSAQGSDFNVLLFLLSSCSILSMTGWRPLRCGPKFEQESKS